MRNKKNTLYIVLAIIVVVGGMMVLSKDNSKEKKKETTTETTAKQTTEIKKTTATTESKTTTEVQGTTTERKPITTTRETTAQDVVTTTEKPHEHEEAPFYGIWCDAYKKRTTADQKAREYRNAGIDARVFVTTEWSNLNSETWYVISAGVYTSKEDANANLSVVKERYPDAYVKYSGEWLGDK